MVPGVSASARPQHAVVTGGASGIGLAVARELRRRGAQVSLLDLDSESLAAAASELSCPLAREVDVTDASAVRSAVQEAIQRGGSIDVLVSSAGISEPGTFHRLHDDAFRRSMDVNFFGTLNAVRAVSPMMVDRGHGSVVGIASAAAFLGSFGYSAYAPTKHAVRGLFDVLEAELGPHGVGVTCVFPPDVATPLLRREQELFPPEAHALHGARRPMEVDEVALAVANGIERGDRWVVPGRRNRISCFVRRIAPGVVKRRHAARIDKPG